MAESCDRCSVHVPNGQGRYIEDDRVCDDCAIQESRLRGNRLSDLSKFIAPLRLSDGDDRRMGRYMTVCLRDGQKMCFLALNESDAFDRVHDAIAGGDEKIASIRISTITEAQKAWDNQDIALI